MDIERQAPYTKKMVPQPPFPNVGRLIITNSSERDANGVGLVAEQGLETLISDDVFASFSPTLKNEVFWICANTPELVGATLDRLTEMLQGLVPRSADSVRIIPSKNS